MNIYTFQLEYYPDYYDRSSDGSCPLLPDWHRVFKIADIYTLEQLATIIIDLLDWEEDHLYEFIISNRNYLNIGPPEHSDFIIDAEDSCFSCAIQLRLLDLQNNQALHFFFDLGRYHAFKLTINTIFHAHTNAKHVSLVSHAGQNLIQYPEELSEYEINKLLNKPPTIKPPARLLGWEWQVRFIKAAEYIVLKEWRKSADKNLWDKAVAILENRNLTVAQISEKIERPQRVVQRWIASFNYYGIEGLNKANKPRKRRSDPRTEANNIMAKQLLEILHDKPRSFDINRASWTQSALADAYNRRFGVKPSKSTVSRLLKVTGYSFKKARRVLTSPDPDYREKVEQVLNTLQNLKPDELFFFIDELGPLRVKKYGGNAIVHKDDVLTYPQAQLHRGSITMAAALSATTNQVTWLYGPKKDSQAMIDLIEILFNQHYTASKIYLTWDAASWHSSNKLIEWLDAFNAGTVNRSSGPSIHLVPLPTSSQFLDVIESIFSGMKKAVIHHSDYKSEEEMKTAISRHFMERNSYFIDNPKRVGKKIWEVDFFQDTNNMRSGNYREW